MEGTHELVTLGKAALFVLYLLCKEALELQIQHLDAHHMPKTQ